MDLKFEIEKILDIKKLKRDYGETLPKFVSEMEKAVCELEELFTRHNSKQWNGKTSNNSDYAKCHHKNKITRMAEQLYCQDCGKVLREKTGTFA